MSTAKAVLLTILGLVLVAGVAVGGYQLEWWLKKENTNRQVNIDNENTGTQTAWRDEARDKIEEYEVLGKEGPAAFALRDNACELIDRLDDTYKDETIVRFYETECY